MNKHINIYLYIDNNYTKNKTYLHFNIDSEVAGEKLGVSVQEPLF